MSDQSEALGKFSEAIHAIARRVVPDMLGAVVIVVTPRGAFVQGGGDMTDRDLAQAVLDVARQLERGASPIIMPGGRA
jgi:hypothetical protein